MSDSIISRRNVLALASAGAGLTVTGGAKSAVAGSKPDAAYERLRTLLIEQMRTLVSSARLRRGSVDFVRPCVDETYAGVWPDDCMWPFIGEAKLASLTSWPALLQWLTDAMVDLPVVPDRVEFTGLAVMSPGPSNQPPLSDKMPLHLPSAWTRYLQYAESFGAAVPRKADWARLIQRSFDAVPFSFGLVYAAPQAKIVGFGFHDSVRLTGLDLMTSLITYQGLKRAAALFADEIDKTTRDQWLQKAQGIRDNLYRLYDDEVGGFVGASFQGRRFSVWGNGLAYWFADDSQKKKIIAFYRNNQNRIFRRGCTRQVAEDEGWSNATPRFEYQNGGFWAAGTGFILPALAHGAPALAEKLAKDLADNLSAFDFAEWLDETGAPRGAMKFLASVSMPLIAMRSIRENMPLLQYL